MKINTKQILKNIAGVEIKDEDKKGFTLGQALGNIITASKEGGKMKLYILGTKLFQDTLTDIDEADLNLLKQAVKTTEAYGALIAGQCEMLLEEIKEEKKEVKEEK